MAMALYLDYIGKLPEKFQLKLVYNNGKSETKTFYLTGTVYVEETEDGDDSLYVEYTSLPPEIIISQKSGKA